MVTRIQRKRWSTQEITNMWINMKDSISIFFSFLFLASFKDLSVYKAIIITVSLGLIIHRCNTYMTNSFPPFPLNTHWENPRYDQEGYWKQNDKIMFHNYVEFLSILLQKGRGGKTQKKKLKWSKEQIDYMKEEGSPD